MDGKSTYTIVLNSDVQNFLNGFKEAGQTAKNFIEGITAAFGVAFGVHQLKEFSDSATNAARSQAQLEAQLRSTGQYSEGYVARLQSIADETEKLVGIDDDVTREVQRILTQFGVGSEDMRRFVMLTMDMSAALGTDATSAARRLGAVLEGNTERVKGFYIQVDKTLPIAERLNSVYEQMNRQVGGQAQSVFDASPKGIVGFTLAIDKLHKSIGRLVNDAVDPFFKSLAEGFEKAADKVDAFIKQNGFLVQSLRSIGDAFGQFIGNNIISLTTFTIGVAGLAASIKALTGLRNLVQKLFEQFFILPLGKELLSMDLAAIHAAGGMRVLAGSIGLVAAAAAAGVALGDFIGKLSIGGKTVDEHVQDFYLALGFFPEQQRKAAESAANAAKQTDAFADSLYNVIKAMREAGELNQDQANGFFQRLVDLDDLSPDKKLKALKDLAADVRNFSKELPLANAQLDRLQKQFEVLRSGELARGFRNAAEADISLAEDQYNRGLISFKEYLKRRSDAIESAYNFEKDAANKQISFLNDQITEKQNELDDAKKKTDLAQQIKTTQELNELKIKLAEANDTLAKLGFDHDKDKRGEQNLADTRSFMGNLQLSWTAFYNEVSNGARDLANLVMSPFVGLRDGISEALDTFIMKGGTVKQFFSSIGMSIVSSMSKAFSQMVADWITSQVMMVAKWIATHVLMAGIRTAFNVEGTAETAAHTSMQVGIHTAGEASKTAATATGESSRSGIHLLETIKHGIQVAYRTITHVIGETAMTTATAVNSTERGSFAIVEGIKWLWQAAVKGASAVADIPYAGPILAIAAIAGIIAAGVAAMGGFSEGGYTGDGGKYETAGVVHKGEYVMPSHIVSRYGVGFFDNISKGVANAGSLQNRVILPTPITSQDSADGRAVRAGMAGSSGGSSSNVNVAPTPVKVVVVNSRQEMLDAMKSSEGEAIHVEHVRRNRNKVGIQT